MKHLHRFVRRAAAFVLAAALCVCVLAPAASAATTMGGADTTLILPRRKTALHGSLAPVIPSPCLTSTSREKACSAMSR